MKKYKLKSWVIPSMYVLSIGVIIVSLVIIGSYMNTTDYEKGKVVNYIPTTIIENDSLKVVEPTNLTVDHPYLLENVQIAKNFYSKDQSEEEQLNSLILYRNTYMENTGVLYTSSEQFDVVSVLDGTVTSITKDEILGNVIEIAHTTELITVYHCLSEVNVQVGDAVHQNDVIGKSGNVSIDNGYENALLFEVNYKGSIINPIDFYNMSISDLIS